MSGSCGPAGRFPTVRARPALVTLASCLALAACGDDGTTTTSTSTGASAPAPTGPAPAPSGDAVTGTGYSVAPPEGWKDGSELTKKSAVRLDLVLVEPKPKDGFANNINVIREDVGEVDVDDLAGNLRQQLEAIGATPDGEPTRPKLDGDEAVELSSKGANGKYLQQLQVPHDGAVFTITLTTREPEPAIFQALRESWRWTK